MSTSSLVFIGVALASAATSYIFDRQKTKKGLLKAYKMFSNMLVSFLDILIVVSVLLFLTPPSLIERYLGAGSGLLGLFLAGIIGSVGFIPAFISYPLAGGLLAKGASYMTVATFITTLMVVGVVTLPLETKYFGKRVAITRNVLGFGIAIMIGFLVGVVL
jgi:uncharacterized membrane protein YraQ (UPF0718 family)